MTYRFRISQHANGPKGFVVSEARQNHHRRRTTWATPQQLHEYEDMTSPYIID